MSITKRGATYAVGAWCIRLEVLVVLGVAAFIEVIGLAIGAPPMLWVGPVSISWAAVPCLVALVLAFRQWRFSDLVLLAGPRRFAYLALVFTLVMFGALYTVHRGLSVSLAMLSAVGIEEAVYRVALPAIVVLLALRLGVHRRVAWTAAILISMALFAAMPGHQEQLNSEVDYASLVAFTLLMSHAVWRGRSLFAAIAAHAIYDYATIGMNNGYLLPELRLSGVAAALFALVIVGAHPRADKAAGMADALVTAPPELIIDLRDAREADVPGVAPERKLESQS